MWKSTVGVKPAAATSVLSRNGNDDDDWETDPDYVNDVSEEQQRWGGNRDTGVIE